MRAEALKYYKEKNPRLYKKLKSVVKFAWDNQDLLKTIITDRFIGEEVTLQERLQFAD